MNTCFYRILILCLLFSCDTPDKIWEARILPPEQLYGELFYEVQARTDLFPDSKTFVDCIPKRDVEAIRKDFKQLENKEQAVVMMEFLQENFEIPGDAVAFATEGTSVSDHIVRLWKVLLRPADAVRTGTLIPFRYPYVVPGGRFREVYYWDSYFTMLGLQVDGRVDLMDYMLANFSALIDSLGFIPNGNRTYYASRSQPPFFALMVDLHVRENETKSLQDYLPHLLKEYDFWMDGADGLSEEKKTHRRVVRLAEGEVLNRYWDDLATPRAESYREDIATVEKAIAKDSTRSKKDCYRHLRAAAESGWDFSSRWFDINEAGTPDISSTHTTDIIPIDLNSLLMFLEQLIANTYREKGEPDQAAIWEAKAGKRKALILKYGWSESEGFFMDYDFRKKKHTPVRSLAGMYPLFFEVADQQQARKVVENIKEDFLMPGGVVSSLYDTGEQWDYPNGWAPLHWITIKGLRNYEEFELANEITSRWMTLNTQVFERTKKMIEKYNVVDLSLDGGGGEYPAQDGFGWTNGVFQRLKRDAEVGK